MGDQQSRLLAIARFWEDGLEFLHGVRAAATHEHAHEHNNEDICLVFLHIVVDVKIILAAIVPAGTVIIASSGARRGRQETNPGPTERLCHINSAGQELC